MEVHRPYYFDKKRRRSTTLELLTKSLKKLNVTELCSLMTKNHIFTIPSLYMLQSQKQAQVNLMLSVKNFKAKEMSLPSYLI
jgi:hypothetical protein